MENNLKRKIKNKKKNKRKTKFTFCNPDIYVKTVPKLLEAIQAPILSL